MLLFFPKDEGISPQSWFLDSERFSRTGKSVVLPKKSGNRPQMVKFIAEKVLRRGHGGTSKNSPMETMLSSRTRFSSAEKEPKKPLGMLTKELDRKMRVFKRLCGLGRMGRLPEHLFFL